MAISKKKINQINNESFVVEILKNGFNVGRNGNHPHWTETPPSSWNKEETQVWDLMFESERLLKEKIIELLTTGNRKK